MEEINEKKKLLLIDDDEISSSVVEAMLLNEFDVFYTKSGKEAIDFLLKGVIPDVILLDILMPEMDGWETFNRLRVISFLQEVPIAFLSSLHGESDMMHAHEIGADDFIMKPFEKDDVIKRINIIMKKHKEK